MADRRGNARGAGKIFAPGDVVSKRYRIVRLLGEGGSGEVYAAADLALGEQVALKTLSSHEAKSAVNVERFRREIHLSRKVTHPNVCRIFDLGEHEGADNRRTLYFTMELLTGKSLSDRLISRERMPQDEVLPIATQIAAGLQAAHDSGVVHRDLKPGNIMLLPRSDKEGQEGERVVITDFGLARSQDLNSVELTESGEMVGTPVYMSPEQVQGTRITQATDIYSFGIVLYEMLAGDLPFKDVTPLAIALKRVKSPPRPIRKQAPDISPAWEATIERCLELDPARRFQRAVDVIAAAKGEIDAAPPPKSPSSSKLAAFVKKSLKRDED